MDFPSNCFTLLAPSAVIENKKILSPVCIEVKDGLITKISKHYPKKSPENALQWDDTLVMPGLVNAHCHLELSNLSPPATRDFVPWIKALLLAKQQQTPLDITAAIQQGMHLLCRSGVTTVIDHISFDTPLNAYTPAPLRLIGFGEVVGAHPAVSTRTLGLVQQQKQTAGFPFLVTPHSVHSVAPTLLDQVLTSNPPPFSLHLAESQAEADFFQCQNGDLMAFIKARWPDLNNADLPKARSGMAYLQNKLGGLKNSLIVHANYLVDEDLDVLASWPGCTVVHCPGSFAFFGHRQFLFHEFRKRHIPIALGTDSAASNEGLNMLHEVRCFVQRYPQLDFFDVLPMITTNAAITLGSKRTGMIATGFEADFIGFDCNTKGVDPLELLATRDQVDKMCFGDPTKSLPPCGV